MNNWIFTQRIGETPASTPGYSIYVGFNEKTRGKWNKEDSDLLGYYNGLKGMTAQEVQQNMLKEAIGRIKNSAINYPDFFHKKMIVLWGNDSGGIGYGEKVITHKYAFESLSNGYYYFMWFLSMIGMLFLFFTRKNKLLYIFPLFAIGLSMAHLLVEVATRYHYSGIITLTFLAAYGLWSLGEFSERKNKKKTVI